MITICKFLGMVEVWGVAGTLNSDVVMYEIVSSFPDSGFSSTQYS